jgi:hypothetical protein
VGLDHFGFREVANSTELDTWSLKDLVRARLVVLGTCSSVVVRATHGHLYPADVNRSIMFKLV